MKKTLRILFSVALLAFLATKIDWNELRETVTQADPGYLVATVAVLVIMKYYTSYRWLVLLRCGPAGANYLDLVKITFVSSFFSMFLPGGSNDMMRVIGQSRNSNDLAFSFSSVLLDRVLGVMALAATSLLGLALTKTQLDPTIPIWACSMIAIVIISYFASLNQTLRTLLERILGVKWLRKSKDKFIKLMNSLHAMQSRKDVMLWAVLLSFGLQFLRVIVIYFAALSLGIDLPFSIFVAFGPLIYFVQFLPISVGGFGTREATFIYLFGTVGVDRETAFTLSLLLYFTTLISGIPALWISHNAFRSRKYGAALSKSTTGS